MPQTVSSRVSNQELVDGKHAHLVETATDLFLAKGFHKTTVREIAQAAGWQMGTLYLYISQKEDVLFLISQAIMKQLSAGLLETPIAGAPETELDRAMNYFFDAVNSKRKEIALLYRESASLLPPHLAKLKQSELLEREYFAKIIRSGVDSEIFNAVDTNLFAHNIIVLAHMWVLKGWALTHEYGFADYKKIQMKHLWAELLGPSGPREHTDATSKPGL